MSMKHLGETFDIHGGGMDLVFPHHENEIAQSCGATGKEFARYWVHNGFVQINQEKMSKSLGNFFTIREIFEKSEWSVEMTGEILRYFLLSTQYRAPLDFSDQSLREAKNALNGFYDLFARLAETVPGSTNTDEEAGFDSGFAVESFEIAMDDDLNTPEALASLQNWRSRWNKELIEGLSAATKRTALNDFRKYGNILGLFQLETWQFKSAVAAPSDRKGSQTVLADYDIEGKLVERNEARKQKNFKKADEIRQFLASHGIIIEDKPDGTSRWKR
jgi:cysteinyl-tRNA synthetase